MNPKILLLCSLLAGPFSLFAQHLEIGGFGGVAQYQGDLAEQHIEMGETLLSKGLFVRIGVGDRFSIRPSYYNGTISGDDVHSPDLWQRGWKFSAVINEIGTLLEWNPLGMRRYTRAGKFKNHFTPIAFAGLAYAHVDATLVVPQEDQELFPEARDTDHFLAVPIGGGFRFDITQYTTFGMEFGWRMIFSDYLDDVSENGR
ncbi:MAG: hypothetical protein D6765_01740, partial [Bacteroidetes bacterium]